MTSLDDITVTNMDDDQINNNDNQQQHINDQDIMVKKLLDFINEDDNVHNDDSIDQQQQRKEDICKKLDFMMETKMKNDTNNNDLIDISTTMNNEDKFDNVNDNDDHHSPKQQQQVDEQTTIIMMNGNANVNGGDEEIIIKNDNDNTPSSSIATTSISSTTTTTNTLSSSSTINALDKITQRKSLDYLKELFNDRERLSLMPLGLFSHTLRLLDQEIQRVRTSLIHIDGCSVDERKPLQLPEPDGAIIQRTTRISIPVDQYPEHNFVGRIIGPRGLTIQELEVDCGCKLYVRGKGSLRNKEKEEKLRGQPNWEHLNDDLHVMIVVEDSINRAEIKLNYARDQIQKLIDSVIMQKDDFKMRQLAELAILNDKFNTKKSSSANHPKNNRHNLMSTTNGGIGHAKNPHLTSSSTTTTTSIPNCLLIDTLSGGSFGGGGQQQTTTTSQTSPQSSLAALFNHPQLIGSTSQYQQPSSIQQPLSSSSQPLYPGQLSSSPVFNLEQTLLNNQHLHLAQLAAQQQQQQHPTNALNQDLFAVMAAAAGLHGYGVGGIGANAAMISDPNLLYNHYQQQQQQRQSRYHPYYHMNIKRKHHTE